MKHWVYIYGGIKDNLIIALLDDIDKIISNQILIEQIVYLRPFELPIDALAHKHLLSALSKQSVLHLIKKHKDETNIWMNLLIGSSCQTH